MGERLYTLKFVLAGSSGVGKTQLAARIVRGEFRETSLPTVGMEFATRPLRYAHHSSVRAQVCAWVAIGRRVCRIVRVPAAARGGSVCVARSRERLVLNGREGYEGWCMGERARATRP